MQRIKQPNPFKKSRCRFKNDQKNETVRINEILKEKKLIKT